MESQPARSLRTAARQYAVAGLLLTALIPGLVAAATEPGDDGDAISARFGTLDIPARKLALEFVEHMVINDDEDFAAPADDDDPATHADTVAPILLLTPRVAGILREVFGNRSAAAEAAANNSQDDDDPAAPVSPVADSSNSSRLPAATAPLRNDTATPNQYVPRYQRQMYRTDI